MKTDETTLIEDKNERCLRFVGLNSVKQVLKKYGISLEEIQMIGIGSLRDVFHENAVYQTIEPILFDSSDEDSDLAINRSQLHLQGHRKGNGRKGKFDVYLSYVPKRIKRLEANWATTKAGERDLQAQIILNDFNRDFEFLKEYFQVRQAYFDSGFGDNLAKYIVQGTGSLEDLCGLEVMIDSVGVNEKELSWSALRPDVPFAELDTSDKSSYVTVKSELPCVFSLYVSGSRPGNFYGRNKFDLEIISAKYEKPKPDHDENGTARRLIGESLKSLESYLLKKQAFD
ncbi:MAG: hypothetical protein KKA62_01925, partial [Nanoarchaeota archaeon]|nr:hypothetical protein [Nanoarchaeota archaeon]